MHKNIGKNICPQCGKTCNNELCGRCKGEEKRKAVLKLNPKFKVCQQCGEKSRDIFCGKCKVKQKVQLCCRDCGQIKEFNYARQRELELYGKKPVCYECCRKIHSKWLKESRAKQTPEEKSAHGKLARSKVDSAASVRKQWKTIKASPELYKKACNRLQKLTADQWKNRSEEDKNRIVKAFTAKISRSMGNEKLKAMMVENGLYDNFKSEEVFHGFVPDEINHKLKIIVEYYGDVYHCNPRRYQDPNEFISAIQRTVGEQWARDKRRLAALYRSGYTVVIVWEKDFHNDAKREIERIKNEVDRKTGLEKSEI